jgi:tetratricopeptide (TPR) repeat protein
VTANALVLVTLSHLAALRRDDAGTDRLVDEGRALLRELRDDDLTGYDRLQQQMALAMVDSVLGRVRLGQGDSDAAARLFTHGLAVARRAQDWSPLLILLYDLAFATQAQGDLADAARHLQEGLALAAEAGDETSAAYYLETLAAIAARQDNPQRAVCLRREPREEHRVIQQRIHPRHLLRHSEQLGWQLRLPRRWRIAYRTEHDGLDTSSPRDRGHPHTRAARSHASARCPIR